MKNQRDLSGLKVLIVEDDHMVREVIARTASALGADVDVAGEGAEGLSKIGAQHYDVVVSDLKMPKVGGLDVLKATRGTPGVTGLVVITGFTDRSDELAIEQLGAKLVRKPFRAHELAEALRSAALR